MEVDVRKITRLLMKTKKNYRRDNNTTAGSKIETQFMLDPQRHPTLHSKLTHVYREYATPQVQTVVLKTFLNVEQGDYEGGEEIPLHRSGMFQRVELVRHSEEVEEVELDQLLEGFPLLETDLPTQ